MINHQPFQTRYAGYLVLLCAMALAGPAFSETIVSISGSHSTYETGGANDWAAESWEQTGSYTDVTIKATVFQEAIGTPHGEGFAVLEKEVGSHAVQLDLTSFTFPADSSEDSPDQLTFFSNLTLGPGTYYLAIYGQGFWTAEFSGANPVITNAGDVSNVTDTLVSLNGGHTFEDSNNGTFLDFRVSGAAVPVDDSPEPATGLMLGAGLLLGVAWKTRDEARRWGRMAQSGGSRLPIGCGLPTGYQPAHTKKGIL